MSRFPGSLVGDVKLARDMLNLSRRDGCMRIDLKNNGKSAFTFIEIVIVVTILGLLVAIGVPNFMRARDNSRLNCIRKNLREIESAKIQWALEHNKSTGATVTDMTVLNDYFRQNG